MWAAAGRVTQANYNSSNELVLGTLSLCDFRVKILTDIAPSPPLSTLHAPAPPPLCLHSVLKFFGLFRFSLLLFVSFGFASHCLFACLFVGLFAHPPSFTITCVCSSRARERDGRERETGERKHELLLVSSHCVKFLASTSFGILCQGHSTNSLDLTNIENICVFARHPTLPLPLFILSSLATVRCNK